MENKIYIVVVESLGTDGVFSSEVYPCKKSLEAYDMACSLISNMAEMMDMKNIVPEKDWELNGDGWYYNVRVDGFDW